MKTPRTARRHRAARNDAIRLAIAAFVFIFWIPIFADVTLVDISGQTAAIEVPADLTDAEAQAVADFAEALKTMARGEKTGATRQVGRIVLERTGETPSSLRESEAFSAVAADNVLRLRAKTPEGLTQGIYWFLRTHGGVRWYVPGEPATVPVRRPWILGDMAETPAPSFESRILYGLPGSEGALWGRRNGLGNPIAFSHNLSDVITPESLRGHPDWRCVFAGIRTLPARARFYQPELQNEGLAGHAAQTASDFFAKNPSAFSFSLGLDDNTRFSQSADALRARGPLRFYRGLPDYSDYVFTFMNRAGKALGEDAHPQKLLGCLAYQWNTNAPSFSLNPNVVPFVASDRSFWHAEDFRREETALLRRWADRGVRLFGLYDYLYGNPFLIPRPMEQLPQWLKTGHATGARAYFAEAYPDFAYDAQKLWIAAALLWDIDADPQTLSDEWSSARYGKAAPHIRSFSQRWERAWETQAGNTYWLRNYWDEAQGLLVTPADLDEMEKCLAQAAAAVASDPERATTVEALQARFALTDAFCRLINAKAKIAAAPVPENAAQSAKLYENLVAFLQARTQWETLLKNAPAALQAAAAKTDRSDPSVGALVALAQRARAQGRLQTYLKAIRGIERHPGATDALADAYCTLAKTNDPQSARNRLKNPSFCKTRTATLSDFNPLWPEYSGALPADWSLRALRNETISIELRNIPGRREKALNVSGAENVHLFQWNLLPPRSPILFGVNLKGRVAEGTQVYLVLTWNDERGVVQNREARLFPGDYAQGRTLWMVAPAFEKTTRCAMGVIVANQTPGYSLLIANPQMAGKPPTSEKKRTTRFRRF